MVDNRISKARVQHHFTYSAWKYVLLAILAFFAWDLIYSATAYRPPANKKLDVYFVVSGGDPTRLRDQYLEELKAAFPDQEEFNFMQIMMGNEYAYESSMQLMTYIAAQQGDLFLFSLDQFRQYGKEEGGFFVPLQPYIDEGVLKVDDLDMTTGKLSPPDAQPGIYGYPAQTQYGLITNYGINNHSLIWAIPFYSQNQENAAKLIAWMQNTLHSEKPAEYDAYQERLRKEEQQKLFSSP